MVKLKVSLFLICLTVSLTAVAAEFWVKKPYQNWSADETRRMLEESPWATTYKLSGVQINVFGHDAPQPPATRERWKPILPLATTFNFVRPRLFEGPRCVPPNSTRTTTG